MATLKALYKANTWRTFQDGNLSSPDVAIQAGTEVQGSVVGEQITTGHDIIKLSDGRFTKLQWFKVLIPDTLPPPPLPDPEPDPTPVPDHVVEVFVDGVSVFRKDLFA